MKILHSIVVILFIAFAVVQWNDPDPLGWILVYLIVATSAALRLAKVCFLLLPAAGAFVCLLGVLFLLPDFVSWLGEGMPTITGSMKAESPHIELVREFLGFLIAGMALVGYLYTSPDECDCIN
ncbi:MAG: transmembrane 220 family protein [Saprospiraceae bacterium]|nr:transmembrane 220 family protein [Saprospiraceae bacterium]